MRKQRLMGLALVVLAVLIAVLAGMGGPSPAEQDATASVLLGPLGFYMIFTKNYILYDRGGEPSPKARDRPKHPAVPPRIYILSIFRAIKLYEKKGAAHGKEKSN